MIREVWLPLSASLLLLSAAQAQESPRAEEGTAPHRPLSLESATDEQKRLLERFVVEEREFSWALTPERETDDFVQYRLAFPSPVRTAVEENNTVHALYWVPKNGDERRAAVVVLHWLGGSSDPLKIICKKFASRGVAALMVYMPHYGPRRARDRARREKMVTADMERTLANFRQAVLDVRRAGDWLASRPDVDPARVGLLGISLGAVVGSVAAGVDPNFRRTCLLIGGGDLPGIVLHGAKDLKDIKEEIEKSGLTRERMAELWRSVEPLTYASRVSPGGVLMLNAEDDDVIPRASTERLWNALGRPRLRWYKGGHYTIVLHLPSILDEAVEHLKAGGPPPAIRVLVRENAAEIPLRFREMTEICRPGGASPLRPALSAGSYEARGGGEIRIGDRSFAEPWIILRPRGRFEVAGRTYEGTLHLVSSRAGGLHAVVKLDLERYVAGVVGPEIGAGAPADALRAQAVAARTYAWVQREETARSAARQVFDVYDDVRNQVYAGSPEPGSPVERAVEATRGLVLVYRDRPFKSFFHSTCGGSTEDAGLVFGLELPPLAGVECGACDGAKYASWSASLPARELGRALRSRIGFDEIRDVRMEAVSPRGRALRVEIVGPEERRAALKESDFRQALGGNRVRSARFTVRREGEVFVFEGRGWGHGVGLCQEGALALARRGDGWQRILEKYYPGSAVKPRY